LKAFQNKDAWKAAQLRGMKMDFTWTSSAERYIELYKTLLKKK
jgi:glycogen synthase